MIVCSNCGHENQPIFRFCLKCGTELAKPEPEPSVEPEPEAEPEPEEIVDTPANCPECGEQADPERRFCFTCGAEVRATLDDEPPVEVGRLVSIQGDGSDGRALALYEGRTRIGSAEGDHVFPNDEMMDPLQADLVVEGGTIRLYDRGSTYGTFLRISEAAPLIDMAQFRIGQQLIEVRLHEDMTAEVWGEAVQVTSGEDGERFELRGDNVFIGRERGHIVFPGDGYVSGSHAVIFRQKGEALIKDLDSSNGTYVRIIDPVTVRVGALILVGGNLFRIELD